MYKYFNAIKSSSRNASSLCKSSIDKWCFFTEESNLTCPLSYITLFIKLLLIIHIFFSFWKKYASCHFIIILYHLYLARSFSIFLADGNGRSGNLRLSGNGNSLRFLILDNSWIDLLCWTCWWRNSTSGSSTCENELEYFWVL